MLAYRELTYTEYISALESLILPEEKYVASVYNNGDDNATIGYGYNLVSRGNNLENFVSAGISLTPEQKLVIENIDTMVRAGEDRSIITDYALDNFSQTISELQARELFRTILPEYETRAVELSMPYSYERVALVSLSYNRGTNNPKLSPVLEAIERGDRAEAWFQIRYNSQTTNPLFVNGIAKRRYLESESFGLYNSNPRTSDYKGVYRMYTRHRNEIVSNQSGISGYEETYNPSIAGVGFIKEQLSQSYSNLKSQFDQRKNGDRFIFRQPELVEQVNEQSI